MTGKTHIFYTAVANLSDLWYCREETWIHIHAIHKQMDRETHGEIKT